MKHKQERGFGILLAAVLSAIATYRWWHSGHWTLWLLIPAGAFLLIALILPVALGPLLRVWLKLGLFLNRVMTDVLLTLIYLLLITPTRLFISWFGNDPLQRAWNPAAETYWEPPDDQPDTLESYRNQF